MDCGIQLDRVQLLRPERRPRPVSQETIEEYSGRVKAGDEFPPVKLFEDKAGVFHCGDGIHRVEAHKLAGAKTIKCVIAKGTEQDAVICACGSNAEHGLRRTNTDKRRAIELLLAFDDWTAKSDRSIASHVRVDHKLVAAVRREMGKSPTERITSDGKVRKVAAAKSTATPKPVKQLVEFRQVDEVAERLAAEYDVTPEQVLLDARFAKLVNDFAAYGGRDAKNYLLSGEIKLPVTEASLTQVESLEPHVLAEVARIVARGEVTSVAQAVETVITQVDDPSPMAPHEFLVRLSFTVQGVLKCMPAGCERLAAEELRAMAETLEAGAR